MPAVDFEAIQLALYARLKATLGQGIGFATRRELTFAGPAQAQMPAMLVLASEAVAAYDANCPPIWTVHAEVYFWIKGPTDKAQTPETQLFALFATARKGLLRQDNEFNDDDPSTTLGGAIARCRVASFALYHGADNAPFGLGFNVEMTVAETA